MAISTAPGVRDDERDSGATALTTIDTDIHHGIRSKTDLFPYLSRVYADRYDEYGAGGGDAGP